MRNWKNYIVAIFLSPFTFLYWLAVVIRHFLYDSGIKKSQSFSIPIICVGNITVGGTGKTPHIEYLIRLLNEEYKVAVLSRGYKRQTSGFLKATIDSTAEEIGDEPRQLKQKFSNVEVAVDEDRVEGVAQLLNEVEKPEVVLLDDAFQHRKIRPGFNILLVDYSRPLLNDIMLPAGRLRDAVNQRRRADVIVITKCSANLDIEEKSEWENKYRTRPDQKVFFTYMIYEEAVPIFLSQKPITLKDIKDQKISVLLVTGIANPKPLKEILLQYSENVILLKFPDHHAFSLKDISKIYDQYNAMKSLGKIIVTTEKDATRLQPFFDEINKLDLPIYTIPIKVDFLFDDSGQFNALIRKFCHHANK